MANAGEWAERVAQWRRSGLSAQEFAASRGFTTGTLRWWSSRLWREAQKAEGVRLARVVRVASPLVPHDGVVVELHGARVLVPTGVDLATLKTVFAALRSVS